MCVCQQGISDVALPMIKRQRIDLGHESDNFADEEVDSGLAGAHPMAPMLKRFLDNECLHVQCMRKDVTAAHQFSICFRCNECLNNMCSLLMYCALTSHFTKRACTIAGKFPICIHGMLDTCTAVSSDKTMQHGLLHILDSSAVLLW